MRNPNRYGTISKLSGARRKPYLIREAAPTRRIIGYAETKEEAMIMLADYNKNPWDLETNKITLGELYNLWLEKRAPKENITSVKPLKSAWNYIKHLSNMQYTEIKAYHMQETIDSCDKSYATKNTIRSLWVRLDHLALELDIIERQYSSLVKSEKAVKSERHIFTNEEVITLFNHQDEPWVESVLVLLYSGFRISELLMLTKDNVDLEQGTMISGVKTEAGKNRVVPIHSAIRHIIERRYNEATDRLFDVTIGTYRIYWFRIMRTFKMDHTPHECRHTFRSWLDSAGANKVCIDTLMGHKSRDVGERIYTHKTIEELKAAIELATNWQQQEEKTL